MKKLSKKTELADQQYSIYAQLEMYYQSMIKSSDNQPSVTNISNKKVSISKEITGKTGQIRETLLGKRSEYTARSVISCDPSLKITEIGVPMHIATTINIAVTVQPYNIEQFSKTIREVLKEIST